MSHDIYDILKRFDSLNENIDAAQRSVKQLPALFRPKNTSPQLSGPYPGKNATQGYLVGEENETPQANRGGYNKLRDRKDYLDKREILFRQLTPGLDAETRAAIKDRLADLEQAAAMAGLKEDEENPMKSAVLGRIARGRLDLVEKYGLDAVMNTVDEVVWDDDWEEIGSSDISAYVKRVEDVLRDQHGSRDEIGEEKKTNPRIERILKQLRSRHPQAEDDLEALIYDFRNQQGQDRRDINRLDSENDAEEEEIARLKKILSAIQQDNVGLAEDRSAATEDVLSAMKKKLGDYLQDVATSIKTDPDLKDRVPQELDQIKAVKTITTDDGHEIKIHGNEDDGFRVTIKNKEAKSKFSNLDEAVMAVEMYCSRRRSTMENADYVEEKR